MAQVSLTEDVLYSMASSEGTRERPTLTLEFDRSVRVFVK